MTKFGILIFCSLMMVGCTTLDKHATLKNLQLTEKETRENDVFWDKSDAAESVKNTAKLRNEEHRVLAEEMARAAKNSEEDIKRAKVTPPSPTPVPVPVE